MEDSIYSRPRAPELSSNQTYCPFKLDMWQLGTDLLGDFPTGLADVDSLWGDLVSTEPMNRPSTSEALGRLDTFVRNSPPSSLHIRPQVEEAPGFGSPC